MARTDSPSRAAFRSMRQLFAEAARIDLSQSDPIVALRNAAGLVIPLVLGTLLGSVAVGVQASIGGLQTAFADRPGPYRLRVARMSLTAAIAGVTAGLAAGFGHSMVASAVLLAVLAFSAGQLLPLGPSAAQVGVAATGCALVIGHIPESPRAALFTGLLVFAGGMVQTVLAVAAWPLGRHRPERQALARLYRQLAELAENPIDVSTSPPLGPAIADAESVLRGAGHDHGPSVEAYRVLLDEAVRARQDILVLSGYADRLGRDDDAAAAAIRLRAELSRAAAVIENIADLLQSGRKLGQQAAAELLVPVDETSFRFGDSVTERAAANRVRSLSGQLRAMVETARTGAGEGRTDEDADRPVGERLRDPIAVLRANLDLHSSAFRHAGRLAILVPLTDIVTRGVGIERGYWIPLTIMVVLRPDFGSTFQRSLMRVLGTLTGLVIASLLLHFLLGDSTAARIVLLGACFFGMRIAGPNNFGLSAVCLSGLVVVLLALVGIPAHTTVVDRAIDTAVGGAIALLATLLWPSWERQLVPARLAGLIGAYQTYLRAMIDPESTAAQRAAARGKARLARSNAEASVDRARAEPVDSMGYVELGDALLAHSHRLVHALTAIDATRQAREAYQKVPEFRRLIDATLSGMEMVQRAAEQGWVQVKDLKLRPLQAELVSVLEPSAADGAEPAGPARGSALPAELSASLIEATDRMVNSLDSVAAVLRRRGSPEKADAA